MEENWNEGLPTRTAQCPICRRLNQKMLLPSSRTYEYHCERCGRFLVTDRASLTLQDLPEDRRPIFSEWVYSENRLGNSPTIRERDVPSIANRATLTFVGRVRKFLEYLADRSPLPGVKINYQDLMLEAVLQSYDKAAAERVIDYLRADQLVDIFSPNQVALTGKGLIQAEEWSRKYSASTQGFVAMWFDESVAAAWLEGFEPAIRKSGYAARRIDKKEHVNKICDEIVAEIRKSRFVVADFTGQRSGVYYEAGFASGLGIPVIWTCRKGELENLHFDVRQYNCIEWSAAVDLAASLQARIEAVIGTGPFAV